MCKIFKTAIFAVAITTLSATAIFAQNNGGNLLPVYSIKIAITDPGTNCPHHGEVRSNWRWIKETNYPYLTVPGTTAYYTQVPWEGIVQSIHPGGGYSSTTEASVNVVPDGHPEAHNSALVYPPYNPNNPITLNPGTCKPGGFDLPDEPETPIEP